MPIHANEPKIREFASALVAEARNLYILLSKKKVVFFSHARTFQIQGLEAIIIINRSITTQLSILKFYTAKLIPATKLRTLGQALLFYKGDGLHEKASKSVTPIAIQYRYSVLIQVLFRRAGN